MNEEQGLKNVIDYIEAHIRESLSAEEIASACYYSRSNTKALFKKVFQYGMMAYLIHLTKRLRDCPGIWLCIPGGIYKSI